MRIGLDFDGTVDRDRRLWAEFVIGAIERGHEVAIVTMRIGPLTHPENHDIAKFMKITGITQCIFTSGGQKSDHHKADVWIDDMPDMIPSKESFLVSQALEAAVAARHELERAGT